MEEKKFTRQEQKVLRTQGKKGCPKCLDIKPLEEFSTSGKTPGGLIKYGMCRSCDNNRDRANDTYNWRQRNTQKIYEMRKLYRERNAEKIKIEKKIYYQKNRDKINAYQRKRKSKLKENPEYRFTKRIESHLKGVSNRQVFKVIWDDVREVYDFYGIPHQIDHMVPKSWFLVRTPKNLINHLDNLQVIDAKYNNFKNNRWSDPVPSEYLDKIRPYIKKKFEGLLKSL